MTIGNVIKGKVVTKNFEKDENHEDNRSDPRQI